MSNDSHQKYADVILPLALPEVYSYSIPPELASQITIGIRVEVPLKNKMYSGIVYKIRSESAIKTKPIRSVIDDFPIVTELQLTFWEWMADYYCASLGEIMHNALPSGLKLESETKVIINPEFDIDTITLSDDEYLVADALSIRNELTIAQIQEILQRKTVYPVLKKLLEEQIISIKEALIEKFKPKMATFVKLTARHKEDNNLTNAFELVSKSTKQTEVLLAFAQLSRQQKEVSVTDLATLAKVDAATIKALVKKEIFSVFERTVSRLNLDEKSEINALPQLTEAQNTALQQTEAAFVDGKPCLIHGVTGSGKTRVYAELIKKEIALGNQVLYLLPEIALTSHIVERLKSLFNAEILVYHSRLNNQERVEIWNAVGKGAKIIVGARSSVFLPYKNLKLVVIDEEHDPSFKQQEPAPRYNARDAAIFLTKMHGAKVVLGSATPSLESMFNVKNQKYSLSVLSERYGDATMPSIEIIDLRPAYKDQRFDGIFSAPLIDAMHTTMEEGKQVLLFQNRRGYSPSLHCPMCGWKAECVNCDVHLTLHKLSQELRCHYCNTRTKVPPQCPACGTVELVEQGFGTERIEEVIKTHFPNKTAARIDLDTAKTKLQFEKILYEFEERKIDILVGTQMITKGIDFDNIGLVAVLNADSLFRFPDFRANERAFQLLTQVAGRAGRRGMSSQVLIQTFTPDHPIIRETLDQDYASFFKREMYERQKFIYPPAYRLIHIEVHHKYKEIAHEAAQMLAKIIQKHIGNRMVGPAVPSIERIRGLYIRSMMIKMEKNHVVGKKIRQIIKDAITEVKRYPNTKTIRIIVDVDP